MYLGEKLLRKYALIDRFWVARALATDPAIDSPKGVNMEEFMIYLYFPTGGSNQLFSARVGFAARFVTRAEEFASPP